MNNCPRNTESDKTSNQQKSSQIPPEWSKLALWKEIEAAVKSIL